MLVKELITLLIKQNQDLVVEIEGCDCYGEAANIEIKDHNLNGKTESVLLITRKD